MICYYYITDKCAIGKDIDFNCKSDKYRKYMGNYFRKYLDCKKRLDEIKINI